MALDGDDDRVGGAGAVLGDDEVGLTRSAAARHVDEPRVVALPGDEVTVRLTKRR